MTSCTSLAYCPDHDLLLLHGAWALSKYPNTIAPRYIFGRFVEINGGIEVSDMSVSLDDFSERVITPAMPPRLASACCISNFVIPGSGTVMSGFAVFCCSKNSDMDTGDKVTTCVCSLAIGLLQLVLSAFILVGWCWSCVWGLHYVQMSKKHYPEGWGLGQPTNVRTSQPSRADVTSFLSTVHRQGHPQPVLPPPYSHCVDPPPPYESIYQHSRADSYPGS